MAGEVFEVDADVGNFVADLIAINLVPAPDFFHQVRQLARLATDGQGEEVQDFRVRSQTPLSGPFQK